MNPVLFAVLLAFLGSCSKKEPIQNPTAEFKAGKKLAKMKHKTLEEASGLVASARYPGYLWTHNDSGNGATIFLIDQKLNIVLTCTLEGVDNRDWEDITLGPGPEPGKQYIYVGDIGDNMARHEEKYIYRFEEPVWKKGEDKIKISTFDKITVKLSDGKKDAEALMIDPTTRNLYLISKREEPVWVYEIAYPYAVDSTLVLKPALSLPLTQIVAADFSADGKRILMKNYEHIYYWDNTAGKPLFECLKEKPFEVPYTIEAQGEAISWARDGSGFYTLSEKNDGYESYLYFYEKQKASH